MIDPLVTWVCPSRFLIIYPYSSFTVAALGILSIPVSSNYRRRRGTVHLMSAGNAWQSFEMLSSTISSVTRCLSQLGFGFALVKQYDFDPIYVGMTLVKPYFTFMAPPNYYTKGTPRYCVLYLSDSLIPMEEYMIYCANEAYKRLISLQELAFKQTYRADIQSDGVGSFILKGELIKLMASPS